MRRSFGSLLVVSLLVACTAQQAGFEPPDRTPKRLVLMDGWSAAVLRAAGVRIPSTPVTEPGMRWLLRDPDGRVAVETALYRMVTTEPVRCGRDGCRTRAHRWGPGSLAGVPSDRFGPVAQSWQVPNLLFVVRDPDRLAAPGRGWRGRPVPARGVFVFGAGLGYVFPLVVPWGQGSRALLPPPVPPDPTVPPRFPSRLDLGGVALATPVHAFGPAPDPSLLTSLTSPTSGCLVVACTPTRTPVWRERVLDRVEVRRDVAVRDPLSPPSPLNPSDPAQVTVPALVVAERLIWGPWSGSVHQFGWWSKPPRRPLGGTWLGDPSFPSGTVDVVRVWVLHGYGLWTVRFAVKSDLGSLDLERLAREVTW